LLSLPKHQFKIVWQLHRAGIATIRPIGKKMVVYDKTVRAF
jgi:hypothetical protein